MAKANQQSLRIEPHPVMMFNPDMRSANLLIPGLIAIILTFSGTILSAFAIVKEMNPKSYDLLSWAQTAADGCLFFVELAHLHRLE